MKKLLLCGAAVGGLVLASAQAHAQIDVTVGGHTKNYLGWVDQDERSDNSVTAGTRESIEVRDFDMQRESELHFNAEGIADNGLTYGFHVEIEVDGGDNVLVEQVEESYLYLSGTWGRLNAGSEDGANYLLQVAAPSADSNIDGIRQYIQPVNYTSVDATYQTVGGAITDALTLTAATNSLTAGANGIDDGLDIANMYSTRLLAKTWDYDNDATGKAEKLTYLSPVWNGFQFGLTYVPDVGDTGSFSGTLGHNTDDVFDAYGEAYEGAARYEGNFNNVGFAIGAGYTHIDLEDEDGRVANPFGTVFNGALDDFSEWNAGIDLDIGPFGLGAIYTENNNGLDVNDDNETIVVGGDYTTGPFQFGVSYLNNEDDALGNGFEIETDRYTGGVIYTAAPGLTFRGSISFIDHELDTGADDVEATSVLGGVQLNF